MRILALSLLLAGRLSAAPGPDLSVSLLAPPLTVPVVAAAATTPTHGLEAQRATEYEATVTTVANSQVTVTFTSTVKSIRVRALGAASDTIWLHVSPDGTAASASDVPIPRGQVMSFPLQTDSVSLLLNDATGISVSVEGYR